MRSWLPSRYPNFSGLMSLLFFGVLAVLARQWALRRGPRFAGGLAEQTVLMSVCREPCLWVLQPVGRTLNAPPLRQ